MEYAVPIALIAFAVAIVFEAKARLWQIRHTYMDEFWHSNGW